MQTLSQQLNSLLTAELTSRFSREQTSRDHGIKAKQPENQVEAKRIVTEASSGTTEPIYTLFWAPNDQHRENFTIRFPKEKVKLYKILTEGWINNKTALSLPVVCKFLIKENFTLLNINSKLIKRTLLYQDLTMQS